jgi:putative membrane protein
MVGRDTAAPLVKRHIAYVHALRVALRDEDASKDTALHAFLNGEVIAGQRNVPYAILREQYQAIAALPLDNIQRASLYASLLAIQDAQGGSERIKRTPMPRGYGFIAERLMMFYALLFPLGITEIHWFAIPIATLVCLCFALISEAGRVLEDPFNTFYNGLPLFALSKTIEINLRQALGEREVEAPPTPDARGILL